MIPQNHYPLNKSHIPNTSQKKLCHQASCLFELRIIVFLRVLVLLIVLPAGIILNLPVQAQTQNDTLFRVLEEIQVTATKSPRMLSEVPGRVGVLSEEEMSLMPAASLVDKIRLISGVNARSDFGMFTMRPNVTVRGVSGEEQGRTLVMVDGVPVNTSDTGGVNWNSISSSNVKQIEVYKGPGSSLYGSNAMGGVINIITRTPDKPLAASAGLSYGTFNTYQSHLNLSSLATDKLKLHFNAFYSNSDGYNTIPDSLREANPYSIPRYLEDAGVNAKATYSFNDLFEVTAGYDLFHNKRGEGREIREPGMYRKFDMNRANVNIRGERDDFRYVLNMFYQREDYFRVSERGDPGDGYSRFDVDSDRNDMGISLDLFQDIGRNHSLTVGIEAKNGSVDGGDFYRTSPYDTVINRGSMRSFAGYLQDEISMFDEQMHVQLGLRYDHVTFYDGFFEATDNVSFRGRYFNTFNDDGIKSNTWSTLSPRIALRYNPVRSVSSYISYSRGFRAPLLDDLSRTGILWGRIKMANPELGPETLDNFEAGVDIRPIWRVILSPTLFYSHGNDFLYFIELENEDSMHRRENVSSVRITGVEMDIRYFATDQLTLSANYTLYNSEILSFPERAELEGKRLTYTPINQVKATLQWNYRFFNSGISFLYKGSQFTSDDNEQKIDPYTTFDIMVSRRLMDSLTASIEVMDILDNRHMETIEEMSPGRFMTVKFVYDWPR